jgi:NADH:ubiquinone oxidoreductase subunit 4 (subunit M)
MYSHSVILSCLILGCSFLLGVGTVSESFQLLASSVKDLCVLSIGRITDLDRTTEHVSMFFARQCTQVVELTHRLLFYLRPLQFLISIWGSAGRLADVGRFFMNSQWEQFLNYVLWN